MSKDIASGQPTIDFSDSNVTDLAQSLHDCLALIQDRRSTRTLLHQLSDILAIAVLSVIAGGNGWEDVASTPDSTNRSTKISLNCFTKSVNR